MKAIPVEVRRAARTQLKANAVELVETIEGFMGTFEDPTGKLRASLKEQDTSTSTRISRTVSEGGRAAPYANWVEHGTSKSQAKPHFWPAYRLKKRRFKSRMTRAAKKAIQEAIRK